MSFGGAPSRSSFGRKGSSSSPQKKVRKKKQEYHKRKIKPIEEGQEAGFEGLKSRVILSLEKLGHQQFSLESGGYGFENWMMSFNLLLDDFEVKAPKEKLPNEYFDERMKLTRDLMAPVDTSDIQLQVDKERDHERELELRALDKGFQSKEKREKVRVDFSTLDSLKREREQYSDELDRKKDDLERIKEEAKSTPFFKRMFGGGSQDSSLLQKRIKTLEDKITELDRKISDLEARSKAAQKRIEEAKAQRVESNDLESVRARIAELENQKQERMLLSEKRELVTKKMSELIASIVLPIEADLASAETEIPETSPKIEVQEVQAAQVIRETTASDSQP